MGEAGGSGMDEGRDLQVEGLIEEVSALLETTERLKEWIFEAETRSQKITVLAELAELLAACRLPAEAGETTARLMTKLFPGTSGAVWLLRPDGETLERAGAWGSNPPPQSETEVRFCIAFRRGDTHLVADTALGGAVCDMVRPPLPPAYICTPLLVAGDTGGVLHVRFSRPVDPASHRQQREHHDHVSALSAAVANLLGFALSYMALRDAAAAQAVRDPLTDLFNRRFLAEAGERELSRLAREKAGLAVLLLDVDGFRAINEACGLPGGDAVLRRLASFLRRFVRGSDIPCRWGDDSFLLVLPEATLEGAVGRAEALREAVDTLSFRHGGVDTGRVTVSIGVAAWPLHGATLDDVVRAAEMALEDARSSGTGSIAVAHGAAPPPPKPDDGG